MPSKVDAHIGRRIRQVRIRQGVSQSLLAEHLVITYQQVQKYETGANRVSASRLFEISALLGIDVSFFFDGLEHTGPALGSAVGALPAKKPKGRK
jgi:transcriptional regulator with XRE-family HTH domain